MHRRAAAIALAAALVACSGGDSKEAAPTSTTTTTTTTAPTTTVAVVPRPDPSAAATALIDAWKTSDRAAALLIAPAAVVDQLFAAGAPGAVQSRGCSTAQYDPAQCVYRTSIGELQIRTTMQAGGWVVDQARLTPA